MNKQLLVRGTQGVRMNTAHLEIYRDGFFNGFGMGIVVLLSCVYWGNADWGLVPMLVISAAAVLNIASTVVTYRKYKRGRC